MKHSESRARNAEMRRRVIAGEDPSVVAESCGVNYHYLRRVLPDVKLPYRGTRGSVARRTYQIIAALCNTDMGLRELAREFNLSVQWVHQVYNECQLAGVPVKNRAKVKGE